uniref:Uncharacterized protein n=1 Tax=Rhizophora mucronata TaxID=61149 RepID=A0A2P2PUP0_RHIMU
MMRLCSSHKTSLSLESPSLARRLAELLLCRTARMLE